MVYPARIVLTLYRHTHPNVLGPGEVTSKFFKPLCTLRQYLEHMPIGLPHSGENVFDERQRYLLVEQVGHAVHEDPLWLLPVQRQINEVRMERDLESLSVTRVVHRL
jgi:hypothetical protein